MKMYDGVVYLDSVKTFMSSMNAVHYTDVDDLLNFAEGRSQLWTTTEREGLAFKSNCG